MNNRHIVRSAGRSPAILAAVLVLLAGWISMPTAHAATRRPADDFVITVSTQYDWRFTIPTHPDSIYNYNVSCDDDGINEVVGATGDYTCDYTGDYPVDYPGHFPPAIFPRRSFSPCGLKTTPGPGPVFPAFGFDLHGTRTTWRPSSSGGGASGLRWTARSKAASILPDKLWTRPIFRWSGRCGECSFRPPSTGTWEIGTFPP